VPGLWTREQGRLTPAGSHLAPATIHRVVQLMNKCVNAAFEDRLIAHNPVAKLPLPLIERREMRFLDTDDIWKLADEIDEAYRSFVLLEAFGGLRLGEMLGLRWKRVDLLRRRVDIAQTRVASSARGEGPRPARGPLDQAGAHDRAPASAARRAGQIRAGPLQARVRDALWPWDLVPCSRPRTARQCGQVYAAGPTRPEIHGVSRGPRMIA
jgi:integrase